MPMVIPLMERTRGLCLRKMMTKRWKTKMVLTKKVRWRMTAMVKMR